LAADHGTMNGTMFSRDKKKGVWRPMRIANKEYRATRTDLDSIEETQDTAIEIVKKHLAEPLRRVEALGYSRKEIVSAYLMLAYHALRCDQEEEKASFALATLSHFARQRIERLMQESRTKKGLFN
jgi:hypothetical protein